MSTSGRASASTRGGLLVGPTPQASLASSAQAADVARAGVLRWSSYAWGAIGVTSIFIALTCWWLTQDRSIPIYDAGNHLWEALHFHELLKNGDILAPFNYVSVYPPLGKLVGAFAVFIGGVNVASPIVGENLIFVPLLALGCYQIGRLMFDARAGLLAVIFVFGSPLLIVQFHVFMLDVPETALVAISIWLILASDNFERVGLAVLAGAVVGLGMLIKVQFADFVAGLVLASVAWGGWRNLRGLGAFLLVAFVISSPWYFDHLSLLSEMARVANGIPGFNKPEYLPSLFSFAEITWYIWGILNFLLLVPLSIMVVGGVIWTIATRLRGGEGQSMRLQLLVGLAIAWFMITVTPLHDIRYSQPLMPYLAVIGTGWIVHLRRPARLIAIGVVVLAVVANTIGATFGVGERVVYPLPAAEPAVGHFVFYTDRGFLVAGPHRDGDLLGMLQALRRNGVRYVAWSLEQSKNPDFSFEGLKPLAVIANLEGTMTERPQFSNTPRAVTLIHEPVTPHSPPTCTRVSDGTGVWVVRYDTSARKLALYCPTHRPQFYDPGAV
jgi:hypothetical protein